MKEKAEFDRVKTPHVLCYALSDQLKLFTFFSRRIYAHFEYIVNAEEANVVVFTQPCVWLPELPPDYLYNHYGIQQRILKALNAGASALGYYEADFDIPITSQRSRFRSPLFHRRVISAATCNKAVSADQVGFKLVFRTPTCPISNWYAIALHQTQTFSQNLQM